MVRTSTVIKNSTVRSSAINLQPNKILYMHLLKKTKHFLNRTTSSKNSLRAKQVQYLILT